MRTQTHPTPHHRYSHDVVFPQLCGFLLISLHFFLCSCFESFQIYFESLLSFILYSYFVSHCIHFDLSLLILSIFVVSLCLFQSLSSYLDHPCDQFMSLYSQLESLCTYFESFYSCIKVSLYSFCEFFVDFRGLEVVLKFLALICCLRKHIKFL